MNTKRIIVDPSALDQPMTNNRGLELEGTSTESI